MRLQSWELREGFGVTRLEDVNDNNNNDRILYAYIYTYLDIHRDNMKNGWLDTLGVQR